MTLATAVLKRARSKHAKRTKKYSSPPPELEEGVTLTLKKKTKRAFKYADIEAKVDTSPPRYDPRRLARPLPEWTRRVCDLYRENVEMLLAIKKTHFMRGKVDSRWKALPPKTTEYYQRRVDFSRWVMAENRAIYQRIITTRPRVVTTAELRRDWALAREQIIHRAQAKFVLFPPVPQETIEDFVFKPPPGVKRPRVFLTLRVRNCAVMGELRAELFTDVCPNTCNLFLDLLDGDGLGHGYVGTCFYRKVPGLYWSGGDVIYDNGGGCYAQRGRRAPIGAENYHFSHSMPGLLSMRVTRDDEMCGVFNITFKPMPAFDLHSVVFGRIIRPCTTFDAIQHLGSALKVQPVVELTSARRRVGRRWVHGAPNTRITALKRLRQSLIVEGHA